MDVVGLIPARGGSKSIPGKNLADVAGKPLLAWTVEAARRARSLRRVVVTTDDDEIAAVAEAAGAEVLRRSAELARDDTPMLDVVLHTLRELGDIEAVALLQPTSPLRRAEHVDAAVELLRKTDADCVVSVVPVPHRFAPDSLMELRGERLVPVRPDAPLIRQQKPELYARNGPAVLVLRAAGLEDRGFYGGDVRAYPMAPEDSLDVDGPFELRLAQLLLGERR